MAKKKKAESSILQEIQADSKKNAIRKSFRNCLKGSARADFEEIARLRAAGEIESMASAYRVFKRKHGCSVSENTFAIHLRNAANDYRG